MMSLRSAFFLCDVVSFMDRIPYMKLHGIRFQSKAYFTAEIAEHAEII